MAVVCVGLRLLSRSIESARQHEAITVPVPIVQRKHKELSHFPRILDIGNEVHTMNQAQTVGPEAILSPSSPSHQWSYLI